MYLGLKILLKSSKVNASGLKKTHNDLFKSKMTEFAGSICSEHEKAFLKFWLVGILSKTIVCSKYN